jgi:hypothetical protein
MATGSRGQQRPSQHFRPRAPPTRAGAAAEILTKPLRCHWRIAAVNQRSRTD